MCGNAIRCVAKYLYDTGKVHETDITIDTKSGIKSLQLFVRGGEVNSAKVDMGAPILDPVRIPVKLDGDTVVNRKAALAGGEYAITCVSMGNPHCVLFVDDVNAVDIAGIGRQIETDPLFPERVNVEFVHVIDPTHIKMRVWERGSGETYACGTGACAAVVASVLNGKDQKGRRRVRAPFGRRAHHQLQRRNGVYDRRRVRGVPAAWCGCNARRRRMRNFWQKIESCEPCLRPPAGCIIIIAAVLSRGLHIRE